MSKKAAKRTKAAKELPRVSPHWWTEKRTVLYCRERKGGRYIGNHHIGDFALCEAFNRKWLPAKIEWVDQQTDPPSLAWKFLLPMALANLVVAAIWHFTFREGWNLGARWVVCAVLLLAPYWLLGRGFQTRVGRRVYRFAE